MAREPNLLQQIIRKIELLSMYERESSHSQTFKRKSTHHHQQQLRSSTERADTNRGFIGMPQLHHFQY